MESEFNSIAFYESLPIPVAQYGNVRILYSVVVVLGAGIGWPLHQVENHAWLNDVGLPVAVVTFKWYGKWRVRRG